MRCLNVIFLVGFISVVGSPQAWAQIYADDTLFIGNPDGSPFHVPYEGIVNIPTWMNPYGLGGGSINLTTLNYAVPERLGGNFYYPWSYRFFDPVYYQDHSNQLLAFVAENPPDSIIHLADFSFRMGVDTSFIGDTIQVMTARGNFYDPYGYILIIYRMQISDLIIDELTLIDEIQINPTNLSIFQNYPNPFNSSTTIEYGLPEAGRVTITIYDLLGRKVKTLLDEQKPAGKHQLIWNAGDVSSGLYFYRIEAGDFIDTKRMVYLK